MNTNQSTIELTQYNVQDEINRSTVLNMNNEIPDQYVHIHQTIQFKCDTDNIIIRSVIIMLLILMTISIVIILLFIYK